MKTTWNFGWAAMIALTIANAGAQTSNLAQITSSVLAAGGGTSSGGGYTITHTLGEAIAGNSSGGDYTLAAGFLSQDAADPGHGVDLVVTASSSNVVATENFTAPLTLRVINRGQDTATGVQLSVNLPAGLFVQAITNSAGASEVTGSNATCTVASLASQEAFTVEFTLRANFRPESASEFESLRDLSCIVSSIEPDANPADNSLALPVTVWLQLDFGDAREGFPVSLAENGARHRYWPGYRLGPLWDRQTDGFHSLLADWDDTHGPASPDDEDGVVFLTPFIPGATATVVVNSSFDGLLDAWADFNNDSDWGDAGEQIFASRHLVPGDNTLTFTVPLAAVPGQITTRWRASTTGGLSDTGYGGQGEVEDHMVMVEAAPVVDLNVTLQNVPIEAEIAGQSFRYGVTVSNVGSNVATGISLVVAHQGLAVSGLTVLGNGSGCQVIDQEVRCTVNSLLTGQTARFDLTATPQAPGKVRIRATAEASAVDLNLADNLADGLVPVISNVPECACSCYTNVPRPSPDPLLTSWFTKNSGHWASAVLANGEPASYFWNEAPDNPNPYEVALAYADVQKIQYNSGFTFVYISGNGLASHQMGPWYCEPGNLFPEWPTKQTAPAKFPIGPDVSGCDDTRLGAIGLWVNGTAIYNLLDGYSFVRGRDPWISAMEPDSDKISADDNPMGVTGVWNRDAWNSEKDTFDSAYFHTAQHQYHSHAGSKLLRVQLGDNQWPIIGPNQEVLGNVEQPNPALWRHSPILGWAFDGHPIYGPYGYSDPGDRTSLIRRMRSGYVKRDGSNGTTDLTATGRTTLPTWKRHLLGLTTSTLDPVDYGPPTDRPIDRTPCNDIGFAIGRYAEDNDYMGHLINPADGDWFHQGEDFDLDLHNGRCCKTPEFPDGTYAYFVTIDDSASGTPVFPYVLGWQYCGKQRGGENANTNGTTTYFAAERPQFISRVGVDPQPVNGLVTLEWNARQGATYRVRTSEDLQKWTVVSPPIQSTNTTNSYSVPVGPTPPRRLFFDVLLERDGGGQP